MCLGRGMLSLSALVETVYLLPTMANAHTKFQVSLNVQLCKHSADIVSRQVNNKNISNKVFFILLYKGIFHSKICFHWAQRKENHQNGFAIGKLWSKIFKNSIRDAHTPQPGDIVFNAITYRSSETVQRLEYFQHSVTYIKVQIMLKQRK